MKNGKRYKLLRFLARKVWKTLEGEVTPRPLMFLYKVLFPLRFYVDNQDHLRYEVITDTYHIESLKFSGQLIQMFKTKERVSFTVTIDNGNITMSRSPVVSRSVYQKKAEKVKRYSNDIRILVGPITPTKLLLIDEWKDKFEKEERFTTMIDEAVTGRPHVPKTKPGG